MNISPEFLLVMLLAAYVMGIWTVLTTGNRGGRY